MRMTIVPFMSVADGLPQAIARRLKNVLPWVFVVASPHQDPTPAGSVNALQVQQMFDLLDRRHEHNELIIGVTGFDLAASGFDYVFGYAAPEQHIAIISLHRLMHGTNGLAAEQQVLVERATKEILHEAGHLMGLSHCDQGACVMRYSQTLHDTDIKPCRYCARCLKELSRMPERPTGG